MKFFINNSGKVKKLYLISDVVERSLLRNYLTEDEFFLALLFFDVLSRKMYKKYYRHEKLWLVKVEKLHFQISHA